MKFYTKLQDWLAGPFSQKMQKFMQNPYMHALQVCFTIILPMIMVGSLASLVNTFRNFAPWLPDLSLINSFSFGLISIFMALFDSLHDYGKQEAPEAKNDNGICVCICIDCTGKSSVCGWKSRNKLRLCWDGRHDSSNGHGAGDWLAVFCLL